MIPVQLIGQRCSGTNYLERLLLSNVKDIHISRQLCHKHLWNAEFRFDQPVDDHLIIIIVRNPYDWLRSVHRQPHHCPSLYGLPMEEFVISPVEAYYGRNWNSADTQLQQSYLYPAAHRESFANVISMRNQKVATMLRIKSAFTPKTAIVTLESLQENPKSALSTIAKQLKLTIKPAFRSINTYKKTSTPFRPTSYAALTPETIALLQSELNWSQEAALGYSPDLIPNNTGKSTFLTRHRIKRSFSSMQNKLL
ncbi:MAG: hypothetical protein AAFR14_04365 [Bacteroidota bacterium]